MHLDTRRYICVTQAFCTCSNVATYAHLVWLPINASLSSRFIGIIAIVLTVTHSRTHIRIFVWKYFARTDEEQMLWQKKGEKGLYSSAFEPDLVQRFKLISKLTQLFNISLIKQWGFTKRSRSLKLTWKIWESQVSDIL